MSAHTPGPWVACDHGDYADYDGNCILVLGEGGDIRTAVVLGFDNEENRDNARLIAAAPDLLEALKLVADLSSTQWQESDGSMKGATDNRGRMMHFINIDVMKEVDAAIAKATGEQA